MDQIYEVTVFKTQGIKQRRTGIPGKWKPHEMNPQLAMAHCLGELLGVGGERRSWCRAWRSPWVEEMVLQVQGSWDSWSSWDGAPQRRGLPRKGAVEICRGFSLIVQKSPGPHIHMRKPVKSCERPTYEDTVSALTWGAASVPTSQTRKHTIHESLSRGLGKMVS